MLEPELDTAFEATKDIAKDIGDVLIYALYPTTGMRFLRWKYGLEEPPPETRPKTLEDIKREDELFAKAKASMQAEAVAVADPPQPPAPAKEAPPAEPLPEAETEETAVTAPMPGLIINYNVKVGDEVKAGDNIVVLEAMKMAIDLPAPASGRVKEINFKAGDNVARDDVLAIIA